MYKNRIKPKLKKFVKGYCRDWWWNIYGRKLSNPKLNGSVHSILFICKGNICRSPFAEYLTKKITEVNKLSIASAGLHVTQAIPSPEEAIISANTFGVDLSKHSSQEVDELSMSFLDIILTMEASHFCALKKRYPAYKDKVFLLPLFDSQRKRYKGYLRYNIPDPYGKSLAEFDLCFKRIYCCVENLLQVCISASSLLNK